MKKIDLHIHTIPTISDYDFDFSLENLKSYVEKLEINGIAITNHNLFDLDQFNLIVAELSITVFPGIEIDLEKGHLLLIAENTELDDFAAKCARVQLLIRRKEDWITIEQLKEIFPDLNRYLLIPHYDKKPNISDEILAKLVPHISAGEVTSTRKFKACTKDARKLTPVIFSDARIKKDMSSFPTRQTFVDLPELTLRGLKTCFSDKAKVCLSKEDGNNFFQVTDDGLFISTGLNIMLGERSTGKTHTLDRIQKSMENVKYIKQFALLENDEEKFKNLLATRHSTVNEQYLNEFKEVVHDVKNVDIQATKNEVSKYLESLIKFARDSDKLDSYSKAALFSEVQFLESELKGLEKIIDATILLIENLEYQDIIIKHIDQEDLKNLAIELIKKHGEIHQKNLQKRWTNDLVNKIKGDLKLKTSTTPPIDINFYDVIFENEKVKRFNTIVLELQKGREIDRKELRGFKVVAKTKKFTGAQQMKFKSHRQLSFATAFEKYQIPFSFLRLLKEVGLEETELHKYFVNIEYQTLNKHDFPVSGGERSEFNLLHEIGDALQSDLLLIDEPESSFDNLFLKNDVNELLKEISKQIPVVIVTHNSTVGASIHPDFVVYTQKLISGSSVRYQIYSGYPSAKELKSLDGEVIDNYNILLCCLEAGADAYNERRNKTYEILKN